MRHALIRTMEQNPVVPSLKDLSHLDECLRCPSGVVFVLCGDICWGMTMEQAKDEFAYVNALPGNKIILKGNHDYWWTTLTNIKNYF